MPRQTNNLKVVLVEYHGAPSTIYSKSFLGMESELKLHTISICCSTKNELTNRNYKNSIKKQAMGGGGSQKENKIKEIEIPNFNL
jgi:hypothetical protein